MISEHELVERARAGEDRAFELLYERYRERIHAFILSKVRDHGRAEDIGQEVFISALRQLRANRSEIVFKPWLYTIARNACIDEFRRGARAREVSTEDGEMPSGPGLPVGRSAPPTPVAALETKQALQDLRTAFDGLGETQHRLLVLREFEGLSYDEIGARLGMTRQMVESGLFRARRKLAHEYEEVASGRRCEQIQDAIGTGALQDVRGLGIKLRRRYLRHLAHCQPCRQAALMAGVDNALLAPRSLVGKVAGLLPLPALPLAVLRRLRAGVGGRRAVWRGGRAAGHPSVGGVGTGGVGTGAGGTGAAGIGAGQVATITALVIGGAGGGLLMAEHASAAPHHAQHPAARVAPSGGSTALHLRGPGMVSGPGTRGVRQPGAVTPRSVRLSPGPRYGRVSRGAGGAGSPSGSGAHPRKVGGAGAGGTTPARHARTGSARMPAGTRTVGSTTVARAHTTVQRTVTGVETTVQRTLSGVSTTARTAVSGVGSTVQKTVTGAGTTVQKTVTGAGTTVQKTVTGAGTTVQKTVTGAGTTIQTATTAVGASSATTSAATTTTTATSAASSNPVSTLAGSVLP
ncbi:MAG TPA: sigma-70 family RNA polymerase sigma factor [Solirubrobacteraceae bacterium]|nr:sigma-70 family RNA polymerase sigma factor [Solirubrobacteraceae bacterium]